MEGKLPEDHSEIRVLDLLRNFINDSEMGKSVEELIENRGMRFEHLIFVRFLHLILIKAANLLITVPLMNYKNPENY